jgi:hypothetical protein
MVTNLDNQVLGELWCEWFRKHGEGWVRIVSGSMEPLVKVDDRLFVRHVAPESIRVGDIVVFQKSGVVVTHRVVEVTGKGEGLILKEKGDRSAMASHIDFGDVLGKVFLLDRGGKVLDLERPLPRLVSQGLTALSRMALFLEERRQWFLERVPGASKTPGQQRPGMYQFPASFRVVLFPLKLLYRGAVAVIRGVQRLLSALGVG